MCFPIFYMMKKAQVNLMYEIDKNTFGEFLAARRKEKGYTQKELAARLFISDKAVSKWERGLSMPDISLLMPLADLLDVTVMELLSFIFGIYFWFFSKERLPAYYDEHPIHLYSDGLFRMNMIGVNFNNSNWPYILKTGRVWTAATLLITPAASLLLSALPLGFWLSFGFQQAFLLLYLGGLFVPMYILGRKYG